MFFSARRFAAMTLVFGFAATPAAAHAEVWRSQGYGYVLVTAPGEVRVYELAADRCSLSDTVPALESLGTIEQRDDDHFVLAGSSARIGFERMAAIPRSLRTKRARGCRSSRQFRCLVGNFRRELSGVRRAWR